MSRAEIQRDHIPARYRWAVHAGALAASVMLPSAVAFLLLDHVVAADALAILAAFVVANGGEYALHRWPFHRRVLAERIGAANVYWRHTTMHHAFFTHDTMAIDGWRDLHWVLLPWWGFIAVVAILAPVLAALAWFELNLACLFLLGVAGYYVLYELLHTASHLPDRVAPPWLRRLTRHHRLHHDPRLMQGWNFNFAFPIFDVLCGTRRR